MNRAFIVLFQFEWEGNAIFTGTLFHQSDTNAKLPEVILVRA